MSNAFGIAPILWAAITPMTSPIRPATGAVPRGAVPLAGGPSR